MFNLAALQEKRAAKVAEARAAMAANEGDKFTALEAEIRTIDGNIKNAATLAEFERAEASPADASQERELRSYSVAKAIREGQNGSLTGLEREMHDELSKGREVRGIMIPTAMILGEQRAMLTTGSAGNTVATNVGPMIDRLRPVLAVQSMGATVLSGLTGNLDLPKLTQGPTAKWVDEDEAATASDATFGKVSMKPNTVAGEMYMSRRLTLQNSVSLESVLRNDLAFVLAQALDKAAIAGVGGKEPNGILNAIVEHATTEAVLSDVAADLIAALQLDDVTGSTGFLTNPALLAVARKVKDDNKRTISLAEIFHGEKVVATNQVAAITAKNPLIYGAWPSLVVGYWSGVDILANPYSDASKGGLRLHAFLDADVAIRHEEAFAWKAF